MSFLESGRNPGYNGEISFSHFFKDPEIEINTISMGICKKMEEFAFKNVKKYNTFNIKDKYIKRYLVKIV